MYRFILTVNFLGFPVPASGVEPYPAKIKTIWAWLLPLYTRKYIQNFLDSLLTPKISALDLLKNVNQVIWTGMKEMAAKVLIDRVTCLPGVGLRGFKDVFFL